jgi:hypothetical protein
MSCPASLKSAEQIFSQNDEPVELPEGYFIYTALMVGLVVGLPLVYRQLWLTTWGLFRYYRRPKHLRNGPAGCRPLGKLGHRNLSKEHRARPYHNGHASAPSGKVEALFVHPVKSCYPVELDSCGVTAMGFEYDRQFCFASWHEPTVRENSNAQNQPQKGSSAYWDRRPHWEFMTQRQNPSLTHLKVEIWVPDPELRDYDEEAEVIKSGGCLVISFPFSPPPTSIRNFAALIYAKVAALDFFASPIWTFQVPINPTPEQVEVNGYGTDTVRIWRDEPAGINMTSVIPKDTLRNLQMLLLEDIKKNSPHKFARLKAPPELRLYRVDKSRDRNLYKCAPTKELLGYQAVVGYQDSVGHSSYEHDLVLTRRQYPIHLQNMTSITDAENQIAEEKAFKPDSRRYRANIYSRQIHHFFNAKANMASLGTSSL